MKHPRPWNTQGRGDTTAIIDNDDEVVVEVPWDGKQTGEGGINDILETIVRVVNQDAKK